MFDQTNYDLYRTWWKRARPSTQGYQRCYQAKTPAGDFFQVEFNFHESLIKLQVEPASQKGSLYTSTVKKGTIIREKDVTGGSKYSVKKAFSPFRILLGCIPDEELIDSLSGVYGIVKIHPLRKKSSKDDLIHNVYTDEFINKSTSFWTKLKSFIFPKSSKPLTSRIKERVMDDMHDAILGTSLGLILYFHFFDYLILGTGLAFLGILFGGMDWVLRNRSPLFTKVLTFLSAGSYFFYTGYTRF